MATTIITKNGSGAPLASDLVAGELAVDLTNGRLYTEDSGGSVIELGLTPSGNVDINGGAIDGTTVGAASASTGAFTTLTASSSLNIASSTTVDGVLDEDNMASDSASKLATQQSIKAYVDSQIGANNELSEVLSNGNTTGGTDIAVGTGDDITFADSSKAIFGAGSDLEIYHDGSNSYIDDVGTGDLILQGSNAIRLRSSTGENMGLFNANGAVSLQYDNSTKFTTTSTGIDVTGTVTFGDGHTIGDDSFDNLVIASSTAENIILNANDAGVTVKGDTQFLVETEFGTDRFKVDTSTGDVSFYEDTGTTAQIVWDASADALTFKDSVKATFGAGSDLQIYHDASNSYVQDAGSGNLYLRSNGTAVVIDDGTNNLAAFNASSGESALYFGGSGKKLATTSTGIDVTGTVTADGLTVDGGANLLTRTSSGAEIDVLEVRNNATAASTASTIKFVNSTAAGSNSGSSELVAVRTGTNTGDFKIRTSNSTGSMIDRLLVDSDGDISFYEDTGTTAKLFWDASAESLGIGTSSPQYPLHTYGFVGISDDDDSARYRFIVDDDGTDARFRIRREKANNASSASNDLTIVGGNVGIGTTSPQTRLHVREDGAAVVGIKLQNATANSVMEYQVGNDADNWFFGIDGSDNFGISDVTGQAAQKLVITQTGNVGINTSTNLANGTLNVESNGTSVLQARSDTAGVNDGDTTVVVSRALNSTAGKWANAIYRGYSHAWSYGTSASTSEAMRIDSSGNLLVGKTAASGSTVGGEIRATGAVLAVRDGDFAGYFNRKTSDGEIVRFVKDTTTVGSIGSRAGSVIYITSQGTGKTGLDFGGTSINPMLSESLSNGTTDLGNAGNRFKDLYLSSSVDLRNDASSTLPSIDFLDTDTSPSIAQTIGEITWTDSHSSYGNTGVKLEGQYSISGAHSFILKTNDLATPANLETRLVVNHNGLQIYDGAGSEAARFDSSGNLLVGKTASDTSVNGLEADNNGYTKITRTSGTANVNTVLQLNRLSTDGEILRLQKDGTTVGSIGSYSGSYLQIGTGDSGLAFDVANSIRPVNMAGAQRDGGIDLGHSSARFKDIYATNGTIQTSDRNEKQDIEALSDAEQRVAVAAKGLLRKFRWKSSVEEKGDDARIHFGIIAQDLQDAFTAEGLDAGRYGMFINSTWTDEETGEERSRMGVRYSELIAFIIAAI